MTHSLFHRIAPSSIAPSGIASARIASAIAAFAMALAAVSGPADAAPLPAAASTEQRLDHISVTQMGTAGTPVILIPGLATPRAVWLPTATTLAARHRVFLIQVNGFAGDTPGGNLAGAVLPGVIADLDRFIAATHLRGAAVIGHSMGGLIGMLLARDHPADVGRLLIVDSLPFYGVLMVPPGTPATVAAVTPVATMMRDRTVASYGKPDTAGAQRVAQALALTPAAQAQVTQWMVTADQRVAGEAMYEDVTTDLRPDTAKLTMPVTVIVPWHEGQYPRDQTLAFYRAQYAGAPQVNLVEIDGAGHFAMLDQPAATAAAVAAFLGEH